MAFDQDMMQGQAQKPVAAPDTMPHSLEAEQALLGILLYDNEAWAKVEDVASAAFYEPFHQRLHAAIVDAIRKGQGADNILIFDKLKTDPALAELGGNRYLFDLVDRAPPAANARDYGRVISDLALRRDLIRVAGEVLSRAKGEGDENRIGPLEQIAAAEQALYGLAEQRGATGGFRTFAECLSGFMEQAAEAMRSDGSVTGLSTDLIDLDAKTGGLHPSDLIIVAGRPGSGKTALAVNLAFAVARKGEPVAFYSLEMSGEQLAGRVMAEAAGVSGDSIRKGAITVAEYQRMREVEREIQNLPIYIDDGGGTSIAKIVARARRLKRTHGLALAVVDYIQLSNDDSKPGQNRTQEVGAITMGLKTMAKELEIPVIGLSQLSRQVEARDDKRPKLSDLRDSGSIEQDADMVWFVYREAYYLEQAEPKEGTTEHFQWQEDMDRARGLAECIIAKQRHGPVGTVHLTFNGETTKFGNLAREQYFAQSRYQPGGE